MLANSCCFKSMERGHTAAQVLIWSRVSADLESLTSMFTHFLGFYFFFLATNSCEK